MGGSDEGIYSWITVNYLLDRRPDDTVGTLEMGGGSSQVAFVPPAASKPPAACTTPSQPVSFKGRPLPLYTTSHLEYGLKKSKAVALAAFESTNNLTGNPCFHAGALDVGVPFETRSVQVVGTGNFDGCVAALQSRLQPAVSPCECELCTYGRVAQPPAGPSEYVAFAFYAERTTDIGMASPLTLADIRAKGSEVCAMGIEEVRQAYPEGTVKNGVATDLCYDMAFIYTHLAVGHGLHNAPGTRISVVHKINGYVWGGGGRGVVVQCGIEWAREGSVKTAVLWPVAAPGWNATHGVVRPRLWRRARMGHPPRSPHLHVVSVHSHLVQRTDLAWSSPPPLFVAPRGLLVTRCAPPFCFPRLNGGRVLGTMSPPPPAPGPRRTAWSSAGVWAPCLPSSAASRSCRATLFLFFRPLAAAPPTKNARARRRPYSPPAFPLPSTTCSQSSTLSVPVRPVLSPTRAGRGDVCRRTAAVRSTAAGADTLPPPPPIIVPSPAARAAAATAPALPGRRSGASTPARRGPRTGT